MLNGQAWRLLESWCWDRVLIITVRGTLMQKVHVQHSLDVNASGTRVTSWTGLAVVETEDLLHSWPSWGLIFGLVWLEPIWTGMTGMLMVFIPFIKGSPRDICKRLADLEFLDSQTTIDQVLCGFVVNGLRFKSWIPASFFCLQKHLSCWSETG